MTARRYLLCLLLIPALHNAVIAQTFPGGNPVFSSASFDPHLDPKSSPGGAHSIIAVDLDGDGKPDLVTTSFSGDSLCIFHNASSPANINTPVQLKLADNQQAQYLAAGDLDGDGKPDIVAANAGSLLTIYRNTSTPGNLSFVDAGFFQSTFNTDHVVLADIDGDGKLDVITTSSNNTLGYTGTTVYLNTTTAPGAITLAPANTFSTANPWAIAAGDIDGDGKPDLAVSSGDSILIFKNTSSPGSVSFVTAAGIGQHTAAQDLKFADLDGDGKPELIAAAYYDSSAAIWLNQSSPGAIAFGSMQLFKTQKGTWAATVGDFDGDGKPDVAIANNYDDGNLGGTVAVLRNIGTTGNLAFATQVNYTVATEPYALVTSDIDGDGKADLVTGNYSDSPVSILRNRDNEPTIDSFAPLAAFAGNTVTIHGVNLATTNTLTFGGTPAASFNTVSDTIVTAIIASGSTGSVNLKTTYGQYTLPGFEFDTVRPPTIAAVNPTTGTTGSTITITGANFAPTTAGNTVWFGATQATVTAATTTSLKVTVPAGATYRPLTVTANQLTAYSQTSFVTTFGGVINDASPTSFAQPIHYGLASNPANDLAVTDFDGDGKPDVLQLYSQAESGFTIYSNTGKTDTALFTWHQPIDWGIGPAAIAVGDLDGDGKPDIALAGGTGWGVIILKNTSAPGAISFSNVAHIPGSYFQSVSGVWINDVDADGKPDLVTPGANRVLVYRNNSTGGILSFADSVGFPTGNGIKTVAIADLDGDGKPELVSVNATDNTISVLHNTSVASEISFAPKQDYPAGAGPSDATIADFDGDGKPDVAVTDAGAYPNYANTVYVFRNTSTTTGPSLTQATTPALTPWLSHITAGDVDGDGKPDLVITCFQNDSLALLKNLSTSASIAFATPVYYQTAIAPAGAMIGDVDGDGLPDITFWTSYPNGFAVMKNKMNSAASAFIPPVINAIAPTSASVGSSVTITGRNFSTTPAGNTVYFGQVGASVTASSATSLTVTVPKSATYSPLTVSRDQLMAVSSKPFDETFPHSGAPLSNGFLGARKDITATGSTATALADLNNDGLPDLLTMQDPTTLAIYLNNGTGQSFPFNPPTTIAFPSGNGPGALLIMDVDGNGLPDIVALNFGVSVYLNTGSGNTLSFAAPVNLGAENITNAVAGDFDGDGRLDLAVLGTNGAQILRNLTANNQVSFVAVANLYSYNTATAIDCGDFDGDGRPDVVLTDGLDNKVTVYYNRTSVGPKFDFSYTVGYNTGSNPLGVVTADFDGDGRLDFAVANHFDSIVSIYRNLSDGNFARTDVKAHFGPLNIGAADFNGDGLPDLVMDNYQDSAIYLMQNTSTSGSPSFAAPAGYPALGPTSSLVIGDYNADGTPDLVVSTANSRIVSLFPNEIERPVISSYTPTTVSPGTTVTITGYGLTSTQTLTFGGVSAASFNVVSDNQVTAVVAQGAEDYVAVTTPYGTDTLTGLSFAVPSISQVTPTQGAIGTTLTVTGTHFSSLPANNTVYLGAVKGRITAATPTSLSVTVPGGASLQPISVSAFGETGTANTAFDPTFASLGNGFTAGNFAAMTSLTAGASPTAIATGDLDGDGWVDIVAGDRVMRNTGGPGLLSFGAPQSYGKMIPGTPSSIVLDDINGDGKLDIIEVGFETTVASVFVNESTPGNIAFAPEANFTCTSDATHVAVGDLDGDGKKDLVICSDFGFGDISILRNTSTGGHVSFQLDQSSVDVGGYSSRQSAIRDLDGDGKPEIITVDYQEQDVAIFKNTSTPGSISFAVIPTMIHTDGLPNAVVVGDLDGDGKADLAVNEEELIGSDYILVYRNNSSAAGFNFVQQNQLTPSGSTNCLAMADWDGDGRPDIATVGTNFQNTIDLFRNTVAGGAITFQTPVTYTGGYQSTAIAGADLDGDGKPELVTVNNFTAGIVEILRNQQAEARVTPNGANPVTLPILDEATVDSTVQTLNGAPYTPRHYDIQPANNPSAATASVTLYFIQQDFNVFNAYPNHGADLPTGPGDAQGIANLRIYQYHGFSATGQPGTYSGNGVGIDPADNDIVWNSAYRRWEITFDVTGFSGFFLSSVGFNFNQTPAPAINVDGAARVCRGDSVRLVSSSVTGNQWYKDGTAITGATAAGYNAAVSGVYTVTVTNNAIVSPASAGVTVQVDSPQVKPVITQNGPVLQSSAAAGNQWLLENVAIPGATAAQYNPTRSGNYSVSAAGGACPVMTSDAFYYQSSALVRIDSVHYITLGPNPFHTTVTLSYNMSTAGPLFARVMDMQGNVCYNTAAVTDGSALDLSRLAPGIYILQLYTPDGKQHYVIRLQKI